MAAYIQPGNDSDDLADRLKSGETLTFVNSSHRQEQHKNETQLKVAETYNDFASYFEDDNRNKTVNNSVYAPTATTLAIDKHTGNSYNYNNAVYLTDIERNLPAAQYREPEPSPEAYPLQEIVDRINSIDTWISYYSTLKEYEYNQLCNTYYNYNNVNNYPAGYTTANDNYASSCDQQEFLNGVSQNVTFGNDNPVTSVSARVEESEKPKTNRYVPPRFQRSNLSGEYWEGVLPKRRGSAVYTYSRKVFIGGVPWDITEEQLHIAFSKFGNFLVQWPSRESVSANVRIKGYLYLIFDDERSVGNLVDQIKDTGTESSGGSITFNYRIKCNRNKHVQIVPWLNSDNYWEEKSPDKFEEVWTIFVGGLHGKLYAQALFEIFNSLFKNVVAVKIDIDEYKYPTGSGSISFSNRKSYMRAIKANYIEVKTATFGPKSIEIQHYMEDKFCSTCKNAPGKKFCKTECFEYFCDICWKRRHRSCQHVAVTRHHKGKEGDTTLN